MNRKKLKELFKKIKAKGRDYLAWAHYPVRWEKEPLDPYLILAESKHGEDLAGNIFYIIRELAANPDYKDYKIVLCCTRQKRKFIHDLLKRYDVKGVTLVRRSSKEYYKAAATAKYLLNDTSFFPFFIKKKGQVYLNTWHGTPFKKMGKEDASGYWSLGNIQRNFLMADYLLYPNEYMKEHMIEDYMLENIAHGCSVLCGYPRNSILMEDGSDMRQELIADGFITEEQKCYAYLPTWRGFPDSLVQARSKNRFMSELIALDDELRDDEVVFVKLHPLARSGVDFKAFRHIKRFPQRYEMYKTLSAMDALITDYSSIFYDYAVSHRKIILFTYDEQEYLEGRGLYGSIDEFPFPRPATAKELAAELRSPKQYDDSAFLQKYCPYDSPDSAKKLARLLLTGDRQDMKVEPIPVNMKENVLIYSGNLAKNGITSALFAALANADRSKRNYIVAFPHEKIGTGKTNLKRLPEGVSYIPLQGKTNMTLAEKVMMAGFRRNLIPLALADKRIDRIYKRDLQRLFPGVRVDHAIQFMGYEWKRMLQWNAFDCSRTVFVHNNMVEELAHKTNCHKATLQKVYSQADHVAIVTEDIRESTDVLDKNPSNITVVNNTVDFADIAARGNEPIRFDADTQCRLSEEELCRFLKENPKTFINVGRFSAEKGQKRIIDAFEEIWKTDPETALVIIGGYGQMYREICDYAAEKECAERIVLIRAMSNPHPVMKACRWFILGSTHEGLGLVLLEASIHGLPVFSTRIPGPTGFMEEYGGLLVDDSFEGVLHGMQECLLGHVKPLQIDSSAFNSHGIRQFEMLMH